MSKWSFKIYAHFVNSGFDMTYLKSFRTKKAALAYVDKVYSLTTVSAVSLQKWTIGFGHYVETVCNLIKNK